MTVCRFAPSPTGKLHVGGARTALFNWAFARHTKGQFLVRIEDTDKERSTQENEKAILDALAWLGLNVDDQPLRQSERQGRYTQAAHQLLEDDKAYRCYATEQELYEMREKQKQEGIKPHYDRRWRDRSDHPQGQPFCMRFKTQLEGHSEIDDMIRGKVTVANSEFDDPVILRTDGTATYNFAAVVDDMAMSITHVIRGEDHLTNTMRQAGIYFAFGKPVPSFAHLPMILGATKDAQGNLVKTASGEQAYERLSKRNAVVDIDHYRGDFLPEAMINYLAQLGWTQPDKEIYSPQELIESFDISKVNRSAARFDLTRMEWVNQQHMRLLDPAQLGRLAGIEAPAEAITLAIEKASTISQLTEELEWLKEPEELEATLLGKLDDGNRDAFAKLCHSISQLGEIETSSLKSLIKDACKDSGLKFARLGMPLRVALTGKTSTPDVAEVAQILGGDECKKRLTKALKTVGGKLKLFLR